MISSSSAAANNNGQTPAAGGLKTYFKTPEGRYKLQYEKTHPAALLHYAHGKTITQVILLFLFGFVCVYLCVCVCNFRVLFCVIMLFVIELVCCIECLSEFRGLDLRSIGECVWIIRLERCDF